MLRNRIADVRRRRMLPTVPLDDGLAIASEAPSPQDLVLMSERARHMATAMARLTPNQQRCIQLAYLHGADYHEIADIMGVPVSTAKSWVRRGLLRLREHLAEAA
jgi:RNA polymerase sigma-70 factor (ECF subfamily)